MFKGIVSLDILALAWSFRTTERCQVGGFGRKMWKSFPNFRKPTPQESWPAVTVFFSLNLLKVSWDL